MFKTLALVFSATIVVFGEVVENSDFRIVNIAQGPVRGYRDPDGDIFAFYNIPYATTPTGLQKFMAPLSPPTWSVPLEAVDMRIICPQHWSGTILSVNLTMQEDCLVANVFTPDTEDTNLPVLVIVHGGGYQIGFGNWLKPKNLIRTKNMIVVTFNYRLGIQGFLCLGTRDVPGNAGMKDQVTLLRWVKHNIASFGGNPNDVTISGYSAGSSAVDLLMLSKTARGLFSKVIPESGSHLSPFSVQADPIENAKYFASLKNFTDVNDINALEKFYTTASWELLTADTFLNRTDSSVIFSPCVERYTGEQVFLHDSPINILRTGQYKQVPMLYGFANMEGIPHLDYFEVWKSQMNEKFSNFLPVDLEFDSEEERELVAKRVKEFYFGKEPVSEFNILAYIDYFTDIVFACPTLRSIKSQEESGHDQIYLYQYSFVDDDVEVVPYTNVRGATHCAQTIAVMDGKNMAYLDETNITAEYRKMKIVMREIWANFITTGKPVPEDSSLPAWPPVNANWSPHMSLSQVVELKGSLLEHRGRFWEDIYDHYYRVPVAPSATPSSA